METLEITLLGREYRVSCPEEEREGLLAAVRFLDEKLNDLAAKTNTAGEKLVMMTALNITHEYLQFQRSGGFDMPALKRRISSMNERLEHALGKQEKLF
ncbi:MAG: cell division protein ZapA [Rhodocyclaceae bacterium]|nr:cell division protein ZapA [Rhodocyclaceae bacterium]